MNGYMTFAEFLEQRVMVSRADSRRGAPDPRVVDPAAGSPNHCDLPEPEAAGDEEQVEARSLFGNLFKNPFTPVNPSRPVSPTNSRLLASPFRKRRLKSQVVGK